jgi:hypothetical protein
MLRVLLNRLRHEGCDRLMTGIEARRCCRPWSPARRSAYC